MGASQPGLVAPATPAGKCTPHGQGGVANPVAQAFCGAQARVPPAQGSPQDVQEPPATVENVPETKPPTGQESGLTS